MRRVIFLILAISTISASTQGKYSGGSGTADAPYQIGTAGDVYSLTTNTSDYDANFILTADINLSGILFPGAVVARDSDNSGWSFEGVAFTGVFDGGNHKISNLYIQGDGADYLGLFGKIGPGGDVKNLRLEKVSIIGVNDSICVGGLGGKNEGGVISNCRSTGAITCSGNSDTIGGLAGWNYQGIIRQCYSAVNVTGKYSLGGLAGCNDQNGDIINCFSTGNTRGWDNANCLGGLV
jgi:hypothetical protein